MHNATAAARVAKQVSPSLLAVGIAGGLTVNEALKFHAGA